HRSKIKPLAVTTSNIQELYQGFINNELSVALLFLKNILAIELREITADGEDILIAKTSWRLVHDVISEETMKEKMQRHLQYEVGECLQQDKLLPHVALAFPLSEQKYQGRLFTLLPLPISTGFPIHIHGIFALTPDRQSLRNPEEMGIGLESRERLLVAWNQMLFEELIPKAWATSLLPVLIHQDKIGNIWSAWPPEHTIILQASSMLAAVSKEALENTNNIFPAQLAENQEFIGSDLDSVLKDNLHTFLTKQQIDATHALSLSSKVDKSIILEYLVSKSINYIIDLPLLPTVGGEYISLSKSTPKYILATALEAELFSAWDPTMIVITSIPARAQIQITSCALGKKLNIIPLGPVELVNHLMKILGKSTGSPLSVPNIQWFSSFWEWIDSLTDSGDFLQMISAFDLLPMLNPKSLQQVSKKIFLYSKSQEELCRILEAIGIPFLHLEISSITALSAAGFILNIEELPKLLNFVNEDIAFLQDLDPLLLQKLQKHFIDCIQIKQPVLNSKQKKIFRRLSIFPICVPQVPIPVSKLGPATGLIKFVAVGNNFPLPVVKNMTFIDMSQTSQVLGLMIESEAKALTLGELGIVKLAIENISTQSENLQDILMEKIIPRLLDPGISQDIREKLRHQAFIPTIGLKKRQSPDHVIHPESSLAIIFKNESGWFPMPPYSNHNFSSIMREAGLYAKELSPSLLENRIQYISSQGSTDATCLKKGEELLKLLSKNLNPSFNQIVQTAEHIAWIPTKAKTLAPRQKNLVQNYQWVPLSESRVLLTEHALLRPELNIGNIFISVPRKFLQNKSCVSFLKAMGLQEQPSIDSLIQALKDVQSEMLDESLNSDGINKQISILSELATRMSEISQNQQKNICAPDRFLAIRKLSELYYDDTESLIQRVKTVLIEYDIQYSFNEFLANAVDAGASQFNILLDTKQFQSSSILSPEMAPFQHRPALILHNNAVFSDNDFKGIRAIGEGGCFYHI
ncbi:hypothetical protein EV360DRAFT_74627, partial [Lentinula raphanica]